MVSASAEALRMTIMQVVIRCRLAQVSDIFLQREIELIFQGQTFKILISHKL